MEVFHDSARWPSQKNLFYFSNKINVRFWDRATQTHAPDAFGWLVESAWSRRKWYCEDLVVFILHTSNFGSVFKSTSFSERVESVFSISLFVLLEFQIQVAWKVLTLKFARKYFWSFFLSFYILFRSAELQIRILRRNYGGYSQLLSYVISSWVV